MPSTVVAVKLIVMLLPGLIGAGAMNYLRNQTLSASTLAIFAIIISLLANPIVGYFGLSAPSLDQITDAKLQSFAINGYFLLASAVSILIGALFAKVLESDKLRKVLYRSDLTKESSVRGVWEAVLREKNGVWATFHLKDGRKIVGYAKEFSTGEESTQILIGEPTFHETETMGKITRQREIDAAGDILFVDLGNITMIEFNER